MKRRKKALRSPVSENGIGNAQDFQKKWSSMSESEWLKAYDNAFVTHVKNMGLAPISWGSTIPLSPAQMDAHRIAKNAASVLNFGCGRGFLATALREEGANIVGIDPSPSAVKFAKSNLGGKNADIFRQMSEGQLASADNSFCFDCVVATDILELVRDPKKTLEILWSRTKEGGTLVCSFPRIPGHGRIKVFTREMVEDVASVIGDEYPVKISQTDHDFVMVADKDPVLIRYCQVIASTAALEMIQDWESERRFKTGVTNWMRILHGQVLRLEDVHPDDWDVIHVQLAGDSGDFPLLLRERMGENTDCKLMVNIDYPAERWHSSLGMTPDMVVRQLNMADIVFSQARRTRAFLEGLLGRHVPYLPHPVEVDKLKQWAVPIESRSKTDVIVNTHYDGQHYFPYWFLKDYPITTHLVGFLGDAGPYARDNVHRYYTYVHERQGCQQLVQNVYRKGYIAIDQYSHHVQGRSTIEFAGLGIPCIGWDCVDAQVECFPDLTFPVGDLESQRQAFEKLMTDKDFYKEVSAKAQDAVEVYSYENSKAQFLDMVGYDDCQSETREDEPSEISTGVLSGVDSEQLREEAHCAVA